MDARRLLVPLLLLVALSWALGGTPARADEEPGEQATPGAVDQLRPGELEELRKKIPGWDELDARRREHIARKVLWLRSLSAADREKLTQRIESLRDPRRDGRRDGSRVPLMVAGKVLGALAWQALPEGTKKLLLEARVRPSLAQMVIFRKLLGHAGQLAADKALEAPLEDFPARDRERVAALRRDVAAGTLDERATRRARGSLGELLVRNQVESILRELKTAGGTDRETVARELGRRVLTAWPEALARTVTEIQEHPEAVIEWARTQGADGRAPGVRPAARGPLQRLEWLQVVQQLERAAATAWQAEPELLPHADALARSILTRELGLSAEAVDALPPRSEPRQRAQAWLKLLGVARRGDGARAGGRGFPGGPRRRPGGGDEDGER